jgi:hypothetical protein
MDTFNIIAMNLNEVRQSIREIKNIAAQMLSEQASLSENNIIYEAMLGMGYWYATDIETNTILFANDNLNKKIGKNIVGKICYEVLQEKKEECTFCNNKELLRNENVPIQSSRLNLVDMKIYFISDIYKTLVNNNTKIRLRFEVAFEITKEIKENIDIAWKTREDMNNRMKG